MELAGSEASLRSFAELHHELSESPIELELLQVDDPAPYERALTALAVTLGQGPVAFNVSRSALIIPGAREQLLTLAQNVEWFRDV